MSSQVTVSTATPARAPGSSLMRKARITKYVKDKRQGKFKAKRKSDVMVLPRGFGQKVISERFITTCAASMQFYIAASSMDAVNGNYINISPNNFYQPFNTTYYPSAVTPSWSMNGSYVQGFAQTNSPIGYALLSGMYQKYKVLGYKVKFSIMTGTNTDLVEACIFPIGQSEIPYASAGSVNMAVFKSQPKAKSKLCHNGGPNNVLTMKGSINELLGMRRQQWLDIDGTTMGAAPSIPGYLGFYLQPLNGATNNQSVVVDITLYQIVEFTDIRNTDLIT